MALRKDHNYFTCNVPLAVELILYNYCINLLKRGGVYRYNVYNTSLLFKHCVDEGLPRNIVLQLFIHDVAYIE